MKRRHLLGAGLALAGAAALPAPPAAAAGLSRVRPGMPGWPTDADWAALNRATGGRLSPVTLPSLADPDAKKLLSNPFYIADPDPTYRLCPEIERGEAHYGSARQS